MLQHWIDELNAKNVDFEQSRAIWNKRADEFSTFEADSIPLPFIQKRMSLEGKSVIDIGFGGGRYLAEFAKHHMELYGIEISDNMRAHAIEKLTKQGANFDPENFKRCPWEEIDIEKEHWNNKFDLVFLSFSPAISSYKEFEKVLAIAKEGIYISSHMLRQDSLLEELRVELDRTLDQSYLGKLMQLFNLFAEHGYYPDVEFTMEEFERTMDVEEILPRYTHWLFGENFSEEEKQIVRAALERRAKDGKVHSKAKEINGYLFVTMNKKK